MGGPGDALQGLLAEILIREAAPSEALHPLAYHYAAGLGDVLQSRSEVHGFAHCTLLGGGDDHQAGSDPNADLQVLDLWYLEPAKRIDDRKTCMNRALGFALVRERVAEEGDDAIAQALEYVAFKARDAYRAGIF